MDIRKIIKEEVDDFEWVGNIKPLDYYISNNGMTMLLNKETVELLLRKEGKHITPKKSIFYKETVYNQGGSKYTMSIYLYPTILSNGETSYKVFGRSGDYGWGFSWVSRAHTFGKRIRNQIFREVTKDIES